MDKAMKIAVILSAYDKMSTVVNSAMDKVQRKLKATSKSLSTIGNVGMIAGGIATAFLGSTLHAAEENEVAVKRLEQVYRSMGQNVEEASKQSQEYASQLEMQIGVEDEAIMAVQAKLATFSKVSDATARANGLMNRSTQAAFDLQAVGFGDASSNAVMLGKALQDPARGAMALARAGALNKGDLPIIKQIQATKGLAAAQEFVMKAVEKQSKGVAAATTTASAKMKVGWSEVTESIGKALLPTVVQFVNFLGGTVIPKVQAFTEAHPGLIKILGAVSVALLIVGVSSKILSAILATNPIIFLITAIAAAAYLIYDNWQSISEWFSNLWDKVKNVFSSVWKFIKALFWDHNPAVLIYKNWGKIVAWFHNLWENVKAKFKAFMDWLFGFPKRLIQAGRDIINGIWTGLKQKWEDLKSWFTEKMNWISTQAGKIFPVNAISNSIQQIQAKQAAQQKAANLTATSTINVNPNSLVGGLKPVPVQNNNSTVHYSPVINYNGSGSPADAANLSGMLKDDFASQMKNYQQQKQRRAL